METSTKPQLRSTSLPSRFTPSSSLIEINLNKIQTLAPFYTSTSIHSGLECLCDLYLSIDELISSSQIQQVNLQNRNKSLIENALFGSTQLLDSCIKLAELLALVKENIRNLEFGLRRKGLGVDSNSEAHISDYFLTQKKTKKNVVECLKKLETMEAEMTSGLVAGENHHLSMAVKYLREIVVVTISVFRALLICLSGRRKLETGFSFVAKLIPIGRQSCDKSGRINISDIDIIDVKLHSLCKNIKKNESKAIEVQLVTERLQNLDHQIEGYEVELDSVFRKLIQTQVSLLNILTN